MHVHISAVEFVSFAAFAVIFGFLWHTGAATLAASDNDTAKTIGGAMGFIL